jgi:hypothetical protein
MSCGCLQKERAGGQPKHGGYKTRLAGIWYHMRYRCLTPTCNAWPRYGGRGIKLCKDWHEFVPFRDWALANGYADNLTIDRIDNNGNYEPSNCQWISRADNTRKKRKKP